MELWKENSYDARVLALLIDEPKKVSREQVDRQMKDCSFWMLSHIYAGSILTGTPFKVSLVEEWHDHEDWNRRRSAFLILYHLAKDKKIADEFFLPYLRQIDQEVKKEENFVKDAMLGALLNIGMRSKMLHALSLEIAKQAGKVEVDYGDNSCEAPDVLKHLSSDRVKARLGK